MINQLHVGIRINRNMNKQYDERDYQTAFEVSNSVSVCLSWMLHTPSRAVAGTLYGSRQKTELSSLRRLSPWRIGSREQTPTEGCVTSRRLCFTVGFMEGPALGSRPSGSSGYWEISLPRPRGESMGREGGREPPACGLVRHDNFSQPVSVSYTSIAERYMNVNREFFAWQKQPKLLQSSRKRSIVI